MNAHLLSASDGPSNWALIRRLLALSWRYRWGCIKVLTLQTTILALGLAGIGFTGLGVDEMRHALNPLAKATAWPLHFAPPARWSPMLRIELIAALVLTLAVIRTAIDYIYRVALNHLVQAEIVVHLRGEVYDKLQRLSFRFFDANASSSLINRVTGDVQSVRMFVDQVLMQSAIMLLSLGSYLGYMLSIHVPLTVVCLATTPLLWLAATTFARIVQPAYLRSRELTDALVQRLAENIRGIQVVKAFAREEDQILRFREANEQVRDQKEWMFWRIAIFTPLIGFLSQVNLFALLGYGGYLVIRGELPLGTGLIAFAGLLQQFSAQISNTATIANSMQESLMTLRMAISPRFGWPSRPTIRALHGTPRRRAQRALPQRGASRLLRLRDSLEELVLCHLFFTTLGKPSRPRPLHWLELPFATSSQALPARLFCFGFVFGRARRSSPIPLIGELHYFG